MLISIKHQFIFIHIHKTAGTSIESALQKYLSPFEINLSRSLPGPIKAKELKVNLEKFWQSLHLTQQSLFYNYYNSETKQMLYEYFQKDIDFFNYSFPEIHNG